MTLGQPLWWSVGLLSAGIAAGYALPSLWYLPATLLLLAVATGLSALKKGNGWALLLFWMAFGAARASMENLLPQTPLPAWEAVQARAKFKSDFLVHRLQESGLQSESLSLGSALLLGRREGISRETRQAYSESGAAHLLALSGLHLGILYGLLHLLVIRRIRFSEWRWFALPPLLLLLWGYVLLAGLPLSLVRAAVMCTAVMTATLAQRSLAPMHALALSALGILLVSPSSLLSISFQLSFLAVFFIMIILARPAGTPSALMRVRQAAAVSGAAWLGTAPLAAYYFHTMPLLSIPLSMLLIPLTTVIVYLSIATLVLPVPLLATCLSALIGLQNHIVTLCASLPGAVVRDLHPTWWHVALAYVLLLAAITRRNAQRRPTDFEE